MKYDDYGREILDDTPMEVPVHFKRPRSIQELIALHVRSAMQVERAMGADDEEDFSEEDERDDILTPYELHAMAGEADLEFRRAKQSKAILDKLREKRENKSAINSDRIKEKHDETGAKRGVDGRQRVDDDGEKRSASGSEGGSARERGGGVSESGGKGG